MKTPLFVLVLVAGAGWVAASDIIQGRQLGASSASPEFNAWKAEMGKYNIPGMDRRKDFQDKVLAHNEKWHNFITSEEGLKYYPVPRKSYKGATLASAITGSYGDINKFKAGIEAFASEVKAMAKASGNPKADAPNRFLVGQGWKIVGSLAGLFNNKLVPAGNKLYEVSTKGNQDLEILIDIAGGGGKLSSVPNTAKVSGNQSNLQLLNEVQRDHDAAEAERQKAEPLFNEGRSMVPDIYTKIEKYDAAYAEYSRGLHHLTSDGAKLAAGALEGSNTALVTGTAANEALKKAAAAEQKAIDAVRACTEGNIKAGQDPGNAGAQASAADLNAKAIAEVAKSNEARQAANEILGSPTMPGTIAAGKGMEMEGEKKVDYRESGKVGKSSKTAASGADTLKSSTRKAEATNQRP